MGMTAARGLLVATALIFGGASGVVAQQESPAPGQNPAPAQKPASTHDRVRPSAKALPQGQPKPANIEKNGVIILVKSAMIAVDQANKTGNYTVLRDLGSSDFQVNTAARLAEIFAPLRAQKLDFSGVLVLEPQLTLLPQIEPNGMLHMMGFFPSVPKQLNFEMLWQPVNRQWRLFGLTVNLSDGGPVAPETPPQPPSVGNNAGPPQAPTGALTGQPAKQ